MTSGDNLRRAMAERGVSGNDLARRTGLGRNTIQRMMHGHLVGSLCSWDAAAAALGVDLTELVEGEERIYDHARVVDAISQCVVLMDGLGLNLAEVYQVADSIRASAKAVLNGRLENKDDGNEDHE